MSTRAAIYFHQVWPGESTEEANVTSIISRHTDGDPHGKSGVLSDLNVFFTEVRNQCEFNSVGMFHDAGLLGARFVVWQALEYAKLEQRITPGVTPHRVEPLNFPSVRVEQNEPGDIEYRYHVWCFKGDPLNRNPIVTWESWSEDTTHPTFEDSGPGKYRVTIQPPTFGPYKDMTEIVWGCRHYLHARNKAIQKQLTVVNIEKVKEDA